MFLFSIYCPFVLIFSTFLCYRYLLLLILMGNHNDTLNASSFCSNYLLFSTRIIDIYKKNCKLFYFYSRLKIMLRDNDGWRILLRDPTKSLSFKIKLISDYSLKKRINFWLWTNVPASFRAFTEAQKLWEWYAPSRRSFVMVRIRLRYAITQMRTKGREGTV